MLYQLLLFFRSNNFHDHEDTLNAVQRNLSVLTDDALSQLRNGAYELVNQIDQELAARCDDGEEPHVNDGPDRTDPGYWKDNF